MHSKKKSFIYFLGLIVTSLFVFLGTFFGADVDFTQADSETSREVVQEDFNASEDLAGGGTAVSDIDIHATFHNVGVQVNISGDDNNNATATLEANINGAGFEIIHPLSKVYTNRFVGSVFSLPPETNVEVRVTVSDPDGVTNGVQTASITTRSEQIPISTGNTIHVAKTGSDGSGNGSEVNPFATIQHAVNQTNPGSTVLIHAGTYHEQVEMPWGEGGTPTNPITIKSAAGESVILDGTDAAYNDAAAWTDEGDNLYSISLSDTYYVGVDGNRLWRYDSLNDLKNLIYSTDGGFFADTSASKLYLKLPNNAAPTGHQISVSTLDYAFQLWNTPHIIIDGLTFRNFNADAFSSALAISDTSSQIWVVNNLFENMETPIFLEGYVEDLVVMSNEFSDQGVTVFDWDNVKEVQWWLERGSIFPSNDGYTGKGIIFYKNNIHDMFDGIKIVGNDILTYPNNSDVEGNLFYHLSDDGVEADGYSSNARILNNRFEKMLVGVSVAPALGGPTYIIRNLMVDLQNVAFTDYETTAVKFNVGDEDPSGEIFVYHNTATTVEAGQAAFSVTNDSGWQHLTIKNNIWSGTAYGFYYWLSNDLPLVEDYDLLHSNSEFLTLFQENEYPTAASYFNATGLCEHCATGNPLFADEASGQYQLTENSPGVDQALSIPGINDGHLGTSPDMGRYEFGQESIFLPIIMHSE